MFQLTVVLMTGAHSVMPYPCRIVIPYFPNRSSMAGGIYAPPLQIVWNCSPNTSRFTISGGSAAAS